MTDRPVRTDPPDYPERAHRKNLAKTPTDEISLDDIRRELKARRAQRWPKLIAQIFAGLSALGIGSAGMWKAFAAHGAADANGILMEYRLGDEVKARESLELDVQRDREFEVGEHDKLREKLEHLQIRQATCCPRREDDRDRPHP